MINLIEPGKDDFQAGEDGGDLAGLPLGLTVEK